MLVVMTYAATDYVSRTRERLSSRQPIFRHLFRQSNKKKYLGRELPLPVFLSLETMHEQS